MTITTTGMPAPSPAQRALRFLSETFGDLARHAARHPGEGLGRVADEGINLATNILDGLIKLRAGVADQVALARNLGKPLEDVASPEVVARAEFPTHLAGELAAAVESAGGVEALADAMAEALVMLGRRGLGPRVGQVMRRIAALDLKLKPFDELVPPGLLPAGEFLHKPGRYETGLREERARLVEELRASVRGNADLVEELAALISPGNAGATGWRDMLKLALESPPAFPESFVVAWVKAPVSAAAKAGLTHLAGEVLLHLPQPGRPDSMRPIYVEDPREVAYRHGRSGVA